jgi:hypothetical protein
VKDGKDSAVILGVRVQPELGEDRRDMLLDRTDRDEELAGDPSVRAAFRHQDQHVALARR